MKYRYPFLQPTRSDVFKKTRELSLSPKEGPYHKRKTQSVGQKYPQSLLLPGKRFESPHDHPPDIGDRRIIENNNCVHEGHGFYDRTTRSFNDPFRLCDSLLLELGIVLVFSSIPIPQKLIEMDHRDAKMSTELLGER